VHFTERRWRRSILLVKGGHCVGDWIITCTINLNQGVMVAESNYLPLVDHNKEANTQKIEPALD